MDEKKCVNCGQPSVEGSKLCYDCLAGWSRKSKGGVGIMDLDREVLISALRHENVSKDIIIQRLMHTLVEKEDKIIELYDRIERYVEDQD